MKQELVFPHITGTPEKALLDEPISITLSGFAANSQITLHASTQDDRGIKWASQATFLTNEIGNIDIGLQRPLKGCYEEADPMGLFWSMRTLYTKGEIPARFEKVRLTVPTVVTLRAQTADTVLATTNIERYHQANGVTEILVREQGLVGKLFLPVGPGPYPGILVLSGSDGTIRDRGAALFASHGYAALALVYFGASGLPKRLARIPLEYFEKGIQWLQHRPEILKDQIGVIGTSRGGELALLLGATFQQIKAVVASSASGFIHGGVGTPPTEAAWTYHGKPLPHMINIPSISELVRLSLDIIRQTPFTGGRSTFLKELASKQALERACIPVEKTQGPILLISGEEDALWPATLYAEMVMERLTQQQYPYPYKHLRYKDAGHFIGIPYSFPYLPPAITPFSSGPLLVAVGGYQQNSAYADADSWKQTLAFFDEHLKSFAV